MKALCMRMILVYHSHRYLFWCTRNRDLKRPWFLVKFPIVFLRLYIEWFQSDFSAPNKPWLTQCHIFLFLLLIAGANLFGKGFESSQYSGHLRGVTVGWIDHFCSNINTSRRFEIRMIFTTINLANNRDVLDGLSCWSVCLQNEIYLDETHGSKH